jgi:hypothetical protein
LDTISNGLRGIRDSFLVSSEQVLVTEMNDTGKGICSGREKEIKGSYFGLIHLRYV